MNLNSAVIVFSHLIALAGFFSLFVTGGISAIESSIFCAALLNSFMKERYGKGFYLGQNTLTLIGLLLTAYVFFNTVILGTPVIGAIIFFLIFLQVLKLLGHKKLRDIVQIYILSFFQFLAGTVLTVDFTYGVAFVVYVVVAVWAIMTLNMQNEAQEASNEASPKIISPLFLGATFGFVLLIFFFTSLIFISVPRLGLKVLSTDFLSTKELRTGFSDKVKLGRVGEIKQDSSPVMRIKIKNLKKLELPPQIYWRGIALDDFDGTMWRVGGQGYDRVVRDRNGFFVMRKSLKPLVQEIVTEPIDSDILFAANSPAGFKGLAGAALNVVNDSYILPSKAYSRHKYIAYSDLNRPTASELRNAPARYSQEIKSVYLSLPHMGRRFELLANEITADSDNPFDKTAAVMTYLLQNLSYTLVLEKGTEAFPLDEFLFGNREGHCEYFATSMVLLLRESQVPARIVNGFLNGEWNAYGDFYLIRESDAHSWVEVFFPGYGWVDFDPTPGDGTSPGDTQVSTISSYLDYLRFRWNRYIIDFSQKDQITILANVRDKWRWKSRVASSKGSKLGFDKRWVIGFFLISTAVWISLRRFDLGKLIDFGGFGNERKITKKYKKALKLLSKKGFTKPEHLTPKEFAAQVLEQAGDSYVSFAQFSAKYISLRFSENPNDEDLKELDELWARLNKDVI